MQRDGLRLSITLLSVLPAPGPARVSTAGNGAHGPGAHGPGAMLRDGAPAHQSAVGRTASPAAGPPWDAAERPTSPAGSASAPSAAPSREAAGSAMAWAPAVGLLLGVVAAAVMYVSGHLLHTGSLVAAALAIVSLAVLTRCLHLDGLADLADGLGSRRPADQALDIMRRSDIGPFGVVTLVLTLLVQVAALTQADAAGRGPAAVIVATVTGRLALPWACRHGVPAARRDGLGALVAGTLPPAVPAALTAVALALTAGGVFAAHAVAAVPVEWILPVAMAAGLAVALALATHVVRRLGGITGDVLGALVEVATATALLVSAMG
jgi:adenosylcobinamide-GDP ribazoletransferase